MVTVCPTCSTSFGFDGKAGFEGLKVRCTGCSSLFRIVRKKEPANVPGRAHPVVVIAHEQPAFCSAVIQVLSKEPFEITSCHDGVSALAAVNRLKPDVVILDAALPGMFSFDLCEAVRNNPALAAVKLVLVASLYDGRRYVRPPESMHGADAIIEKHRIPDDLLQLVNRLIPAGCGYVGLPSAPAPVDLPEIPPVEPLSPEHKKAQRLARVIVADIALYNKALVEEGARNGNLRELLEDDIREGRALYERRVAEEVRSCTSYLDEALEELAARKRDGLNR